MQGDQEHQESQVVAVIHKAGKQEIRVSLSRFKGRAFADVRTYVPNQQGEWIPTQKGLTVGIQQLEELEEAVLKLRKAAEHLTHPF